MSYKPRHAARRHPGRKIALAAGTAALTAASLLGGTPPAHASETLGNQALDWAESHAYGKPYGWGGTGPYDYDCSGLVYAALRAVDRKWPAGVRTTYDLLGSPHLVRTWNPQRGDLAFYGPGHVEFVTVWYHQTFGAHDTGTTVGWVHYGYGWQPTMFFRIAW